MANRRDYGSGSVYQRASDGRWVGTVEAGVSARGTRRRITVTGKSRAEATKALNRRRADIARDGLPAAGTRPTVNTWAAVWLDEKVTRLRPKAYGAAASAVRKWIVPTIGHRRLDQLTPADVRAVSKAVGKECSPNQARAVHRVLHTMLKEARVDYEIPRRVFDVKAPEESVTDRSAILPEHIAPMLHVAAGLPQSLRWAFTLLYGVRQAEALGLTWEHVDLDAGVVTLAWQLQALPYVDRHDKSKGFRAPTSLRRRHLVDAWHLVPPKTAAGAREIPLTGYMVDAFDSWRLRAPENPWGLVFPSATGRPANTKFDFEEWCAIQCTAEVGHPSGRYYYLHEARNNAATIMRDQGVDGTVIMALLGHTSITMSQRYMTTGTVQKRQAVERVAGVLGLERALPLLGDDPAEAEVQPRDGGEVAQPEPYIGDRVRPVDDPERQDDDERGSQDSGEQSSA